MNIWIKENKFFYVLIILGLIACFVLLGQRMQVERANKAYDIVLDYTELKAMADQSDKDISWWLSFFKDQGIDKVALQEESVSTLMEQGKLPVCGKVLDQLVSSDSDWKKDYPTPFIQAIENRGYDRFDVIIETGDLESTALVRRGIEERTDSDRYLMYPEGDRIYVFLDGDSEITLYSEKYKMMNDKNLGVVERVSIRGSKLLYMSLGFLPEDVKSIQAAGMKIVPRTLAYNGWNGNKYAEAVKKEYARYDIKTPYLISGGEALLGYDDGLNFGKDFFNETGASVGLIENTTQLQNILQFGVEEVVRDSDFKSVRVFTVWNYIQNRYQYYGYPGAKEVENTLFRAITERNIRVIYFKPVMEFKSLHTYVTEPEVYTEMFSNLDLRLAKHGFHRGTAEAMPPLEVGLIWQFLLALGCVGAVLMLFEFIFPSRKKLLLGLGILFILGALAGIVLLPEKMPLLLSFGACVLFACLAITFYTGQAAYLSAKLSKDAPLGKIIIGAMAILAVSVLIALMGGLMTAAPISSTGFMLELNIFRGVKIGQLIPIAYFALAYLVYFGFKGENKAEKGLALQDVKKVLNLEIKVWMVLLGVILLGAGAYYIIRTGHSTTIQVSSLEMILRNDLEDLLLARPRTKEFLIAFPAIMLMVYSTVRRWKIGAMVFGLAGVLGMTSVVNTFEHIRTPLYLGFTRTAYSLIFGIVLGIIAIIVLDALYKIIKKLVKVN